MRIFIIDPDLESRETLSSRVEEAVRQIGLKRCELVAGGLELLGLPEPDEDLACCFLGPGTYEDLEQSLSFYRGNYPTVPVAVVLDNEAYGTDAVELRRTLAVRIIAVADIAQMAGFMLDSEMQHSAVPGSQNRGVITVVQFKGGVGASTVAAGLASCWARHDLSVALLDLDDVNPQLTDWGRVGMAQRSTVSELIRQGEVPSSRINEIANPVEGYDGTLVVVPQPELYQESFHYKADVIESAPSAAQFVVSLVSALREEFDVIVIDSGRSWGISTFATLPLSQQVLLITDDDGMSVRRSFDNLQRLFRESDDPDEFDLSRWNVVLNGYTGRLLSPKDLSAEIQSLDMFPDTAMLYTIPFSERGRQWGAPGQSFYDLAEPSVRLGLKKIAFNLVPFRQEVEEPIYGKLRKRLHKLVSAPTSS